MPSSSIFAIGVDIGGSHITSAAINLNNGRVFNESHVRMRVNALSEADNIFMLWTQAIEQSIAIVGKERIKGVGIAMPAPFDYDSGICLINDESQKKYLSLYKLNIKQILSQRLHFNPNEILFKNDAECFLLGEIFSGGGLGARNAIGITLGTGFGSAILFNGVSKDANLWCAPFRTGIVEDYLSTRWFIHRYEELTGRSIRDVKELASLIETEGTAQLVFNEFGESLAEFLLPIIMKYDADMLILGGNISNAIDLFIEPLQVQAALKAPALKIVKSSLAEEAALVGAASLFKLKAPFVNIN